MKRKAVIGIALIGGLAVAGTTTIPLVSHARMAAEDRARLSRLRQIAGTLQLYADDRTHGDIGWQSVVDQLRDEDPSLLSPLRLRDGSTVSYEVVPPMKSSRDGHLSSLVVIREVLAGKQRPVAALYADGHVAFGQ